MRVTEHNTAYLSLFRSVYTMGGGVRWAAESPPINESAPVAKGCVPCYDTGNVL